MTRRRAPPLPQTRLKVRMPFGFEAEGEGLLPILCLAGLAALFMLLWFLT
ncbi:MAG: hypothetical protein ABL932_00790 [Terricaulis sp.]